MMSSMAPRSVRFGVWSWKLSNVGRSLDGWPKIYYLEFLRASEGTLSRRSRLHLQSLAPTNPHKARVVGCGPFCLCVIHKEGLCPSSGDINELMMIMMMEERCNFFVTPGHTKLNPTKRVPTLSPNVVVWIWLVIPTLQSINLKNITDLSSLFKFIISSFPVHRKAR
jgi:hypothetical protein